MSDRLHYRYLLVGGGMAADAAARGIRSVDPAGTIGLIGAEPHPPYNRPPLSKGLWKRARLERIWRQTKSLGVSFHLGRTVTGIDPDDHTVIDDQGQRYHYERLLLATGGSPIHLPFGGEDVIYYRTLADYQRLRGLAEEKSRFLVIGGGFIGSEIAAALAQHGRQVSMVFLEAGIGGRIFPPDLSAALTQTYVDHGVQVLPGQSMQSIQLGPDGIYAQIGAEARVFDGVVAGLGIRPNVSLAQAAGLAVDNGIVVDAGLRTSQADIFAAGDCVAFFNPALGKRLRVEHEEHANQSGLLAGQAMAGQPVQYDLLPSAYSDIFDISYESVGELDARLEVVSDWQEPYQRGTLYYLERNQLRGVLLWNLPGRIAAARALIADGGEVTAESLAGRIR